MIVLIGTNTHLVQQGQIISVDCPKCLKKDTLSFSIYSKYVHLTMVPLFAVGKIFESKCSNCNESFDYENFLEIDQQKIINQKEIKKAKTPFWTYTGIIILIGYIFFAINYYLENNDLISERIKKPYIGDVYNLKLENGYYSTIRIDQIKNDSIYVTQNDYDTYLPFDIDEIDIPKNYTKSKFVYSKKELNTLYEKDIISSIKRKE